MIYVSFSSPSVLSRQSRPFLLANATQCIWECLEQLLLLPLPATLALSHTLCSCPRETCVAMRATNRRLLSPCSSTIDRRQGAQPDRPVQQGHLFFSLAKDSELMRGVLGSSARNAAGVNAGAWAMQGNRKPLMAGHKAEFPLAPPRRLPIVTAEPLLQSQQPAQCPTRRCRPCGATPARTGGCTDLAHVRGFPWHQQTR